MKNYPVLALTVLSLFLYSLKTLAAGLGDDGYEVGDYASDFELKNVDGSMVSLADYEDASGFIVIFTCNHCPFSVAYEDRIIAIDQEYAPLGYPVIAINPNDPEIQPADSYENMIVRSDEKGFSFPYLWDETQEVALTYGAIKTPHVFLLEKEAEDKLKVAYIGAIDDNTYEPEQVETHYLKDALTSLISGEEPDPAFTKAIGCSVKYRN